MSVRFSDFPTPQKPNPETPPEYPPLPCPAPDPLHQLRSLPQSHNLSANPAPRMATPHITRLVAELAGFITKRKGKFHLTKSFRDLQDSDPFAVYPRLFRTYVLEFNWGYWDRHEEANFIQQSCVYSLYLLHLFGNKNIHRHSTKTVFYRHSHQYWKNSRKQPTPHLSKIFDTAIPTARSFTSWDFLGLPSLKRFLQANPIVMSTISRNHPCWMRSQNFRYIPTRDQATKCIDRA